MPYVLLGCVLIFASTFVHAMAMVVAIKSLRFLHRHPLTRPSPFTRPAPIATLVLVMFLATVVETSMWSGIYVWLGAFDTFSEASYFSLVTFTTLGYGDVLMTGPWRVLAAIEAANGSIMFGWSTALVYAAVQHVYFKSEIQDGSGSD